MDKRTAHAQNVISMSDYQPETGYAAISQVEAYWEALRGERLMPKRSDIDPRGIEIVALLHRHGISVMGCFVFGLDADTPDIFRRTAENPLYRIEKRPKLRSRQGQYAVIGIDGQVLKRGHDLKTVLRVLERKLIRAVE